MSHAKTPLVGLRSETVPDTASAVHCTYYNFVRIHQTLRVTPAMAAGVSERLWEIGDIVTLVEAAEAKPTKRGPYGKRNAA